MKYGTEQGHFLGQEKLTLIITRQILGLNEVIFGTGEVDFGSLQDELWDITMCFFGTGEVNICVITR